MDIGEIEEIGTRKIPTYTPGKAPVVQPPARPQPQPEPLKVPEKEKEHA